MVIDKNIKCCPYCGGEEYYIKQSYKGNCEYVLRFDGDEAENGDIHQGTQYRNTSKYAWCQNCKKRLFQFEE